MSKHRAEGVGRGLEPADARQRMIFLRNRLADYEIAVARFYLKRGAYVGAANRAKGVITGFDGAPVLVAGMRARYARPGVAKLRSYAKASPGASRALIESESPPSALWSRSSITVPSYRMWNS